MRLTMMLPAKRTIQWNYAAQLGVTDVITKAAPELSGRKDPSDRDSLYEIQKEFQQAGLRLYGLEGDEFDMSRIKLRLPGWEEDICRYQQMLKNMGELGIPLLCYNFMAGVGWFRTDFGLLERGGARTCGFCMERTREGGEKALVISREEMWQNYENFIKAVMPAAEKAGVRMALHPDDPPVEKLLGYSRIFTGVDSYRRAMSLTDSPSHGITFCQSCFKLMGEDVYGLLQEFGEKVFFLHIRDVEGSRMDFRETFHDNGSTDMARLLKLAAEFAPDCAVRPDHTPAMAGEEEMQPGYSALGNVFAVGYIRGIAHGLGVNLT